MLNVNEYFNGFQIRIIGTPVGPIFYASDMGDVLGIEKIRNTLSNFGPDDLVSPEFREQHKIITFRSNGKKDSRIHLLTLQGVIRLINVSRKDYANEFRKFITELVNTVRLQQEAETGLELKLGGTAYVPDTNTTSDVLFDKETKFNQDLKVRTKLRPLYIFEKPCDPTKNQQILSDDISSDEDEDIQDSDNIVYIMKKIKQCPYDEYYQERLQENSLTTDGPSNRCCYLIVTDQYFCDLYLKYKLETTLYTINPEDSIKYLRKQWSSFVGSSQRLKDKLLLTMEKNFFIEDLKKHLS